LTRVVERARERESERWFKVVGATHKTAKVP
jgi:hypothetical protein